MARYNIVKVGDEILREIAQPVRRFNDALHIMLDNMAETMYAADGVGLAAPQIGVSKRIVVIDDGEALYELINPEIIEASGEMIDEEGCLSVPNEQHLVKRFSYVKVKAQDRFGNEQIIEADGTLLAKALQHEIDHLEGILYIDKALSEKEEKEYWAEYRKNVKRVRGELRK